MMKKVGMEILPKQAQDFLEKTLSVFRKDYGCSEEELDHIIKDVLKAFLTRKKANFFIGQLVVAGGIGRWIKTNPEAITFFETRADHYHCGSWLVCFSSKKEYKEYSSFWKRSLCDVDLKDKVTICEMPTFKSTNPNSI